jgi:hypothetical protein
LSAADVQHADEVAAALGTKRQLWLLHLGESDLSDAGFRRLPLENLRELDVAGSNVTPGALADLSRCRQLTGLTIDGHQFTAEFAEQLRRLPYLKLTLRGSSVTDEHVRAHHRLPLGEVLREPISGSLAGRN